MLPGAALSELCVDLLREESETGAAWWMGTGCMGGHGAKDSSIET